MIRLAVRAPAEAAEPVNAALLELCPTGVERVDGDGFVEFAVYGAPGELPSLPEGEADVGGTRVSVRGEEVPDDWSERWKRFHRPQLVAGRLYVRPPWEARMPAEEAIDVVVDPAQAFGTGTHPTTRLCLELLAALDPRGSLADLGCGSGVLAIAAAKLGFSPVRAYDFDRAAIAATDSNAHENGAELAAVERVDLRTEPAPTADTVVANLMRPLLLQIARQDPCPERLIASGLLDEEADEIAAAFAPLVERRRLSLGGWAALLLAR
jgi:ribosomal protein L11 methyltransferase